MKIKDGFVLREVAGDVVVLPTGDMDVDAMITLNDTGAFLWRVAEKETTREEMIQALLGEYDVDEKTARQAVEAFVQKLNDHGFLE